MLNFSIQSKLSVSVRLDGKKYVNTDRLLSLSLSLVHSSYLRAPPSLSLSATSKLYLKVGSRQELLSFPLCLCHALSSPQCLEDSW